MGWGDWGLEFVAGRNGPTPPMTMEPYTTAHSNGIMARHADDGRPLGHLNWYTDGEIETVRTHPDFLRRGVASAMLKHAQAYPQHYKADTTIHHSNELTGSGRGWANSDPAWNDPGDEHVIPGTEDVSRWGDLAVQNYTPAHIPYTGQNEEELNTNGGKRLKPHLQMPYSEKVPYVKKVPGRTAGRYQHTWPDYWENSIRPDVPFDKRWSPNHREHVPGPWEQRTAGLNGDLPQGLTFRHHPTNATIPRNADTSRSFSAPAVSAHLGDQLVGTLEYHPAYDRLPEKKGEVSMIQVHRDHQRKGIGNALYDWTKTNAEPDLHHSELQSGAGHDWARAEESRSGIAPPSSDRRVEHHTTPGGQQIKLHVGRTAAALPQKIYRGFQMDLPHDLEQHVWNMDKMPLQVNQVGQHLGIGPALLDHMQSNHPGRTNEYNPQPDLGLGRHWTDRPEFAETASRQGGAGGRGGHRVVIEADHPGEQYLDPEHTGVGGSRTNGHTPWASEGEHTLLPNTPMNITSVKWNGKEVLHDPRYEKDMPGQYGIPYTGGPRQHTAAAVPEYMYHATNEYNAQDIKDSGSLVPNAFDYGTDQGSWPDGSDEDRSYWHHDPKVTESFHPEGGGAPVLLRAPRHVAPFKQEHGTGDSYSTHPVDAQHLEVHSGGDQWTPLHSW